MDWKVNSSVASALSFWVSMGLISHLVVEEPGGCMVITGLGLNTDGWKTCNSKAGYTVSGFQQGIACMNAANSF